MKVVICLLLAGYGFYGVADSPQMKVGYAKADITPPMGTYMPGYYKVRHAKSVLDPLQVNMLAFTDGRTSALVAQLDAMAISDSVADDMRDAIVRATGINREAILLHASHTHDGGYLMGNRKSHSAEGLEYDDEGIPPPGPLDNLYIDLCISRVVDAAVKALSEARPASFSIGRSEAKRISFGRRYLMKDGKVITNPGTNNPDIVRPVGTADETVQVLRIDRDGAKAICVINFQTHPDTVGGETISADWPGLTRDIFEAATMGETHCVVINGMEGDVNHCNVMPRPGELNGLKHDFDAVDRGYDHTKHMANVLAGAALSVWIKCVPVEAGSIRFAKADVKVPAQKAKDSDEKNLAWAKKVWALHEAGKDDEISKWLGCYEMQLTTEVARAGRIIRMAGHADYHLIPVWGVSLGDVAFGGFPGEPFNDIGIAIRKDSPFKMTILSCLTNGSRGYFPFSDSYKQGGYESATSPFGPSVADDLIAGECKLLISIK